MNDDDRVAYLAGEDGGAVPTDAVDPTDVDDRADLDDLDELRALLADEALWAEPPAGLEDSIVAAIAGEARPEARPDAPSAPVPPARPVSSLDARRSRRWGVVLASAAAVVLVAAAGVFLVTRDGTNEGTAVELTPTDVLPGAAGTAHVKRFDSGWRILLDATGLPRLDDGAFYQAWLRDADGVLVPIGTFNEGADVVLWAGVSPERFSTLTVTEERADGDQASSGRRVLVGTITLDADATS